MTCAHPNPIPHAAVYLLGNPGDAPMFALAVHVFCPICQTKFRFLGDMPTSAPGDAQMAIIEGRGAWVDAERTELAVMVAPDVGPGDDLLNSPVVGRA